MDDNDNSEDMDNDEDNDEDDDDDDGWWCGLPLSGASGKRFGGRNPTGSRKPREGGKRKQHSRTVFMGSGVGVVQPPISPPKTNARLGPSRSDSQVPGKDERRRRTVEVRMRLQSIHPNPGLRDKSEDSKEKGSEEEGKG